jgi:hypothetical protein
MGSEAREIHQGNALLTAGVLSLARGTSWLDFEYAIRLTC